MTTETDKLRELLEDLQSQVAFQEDTIAALDGVVAQQQQEIILLRRQVELLGERQKAQAEQLSEVVGNATEKPPHY